MYLKEKEEKFITQKECKKFSLYNGHKIINMFILEVKKQI